jgi:N-acetylmuramic acid 6-phosphate etherase
MMDFIRYTEQDSNHNDLEKKPISDLIARMHEEDQNAVSAVGKVLKPLDS